MPRDHKPCLSCAQPIIWVTHARTGNRMPIEHAPDDGNILLNQNDDAVTFQNRAAAEAALDNEAFEDILDPGGVLFISHHARCPKGEQWRGKKRGDDDAPDKQEALEL